MFFAVRLQRRWPVGHAISAPSEQAVRERLAEDNWAQNGMLTVTSIEPWTALLDGRTT
jgi:hypothetical protein